MNKNSSSIQAIPSAALQKLAAAPMAKQQGSADTAAALNTVSTSPPVPVTGDGMMCTPNMTMYGVSSSNGATQISLPDPKAPVSDMGFQQNMVGQTSQTDNAAKIMQQPNLQQNQIQGQMLAPNSASQMIPQQQPQTGQVHQQPNSQQPQMQGNNP